MVRRVANKKHQLKMFKALVVIRIRIRIRITYFLSIGASGA